MKISTFKPTEYRNCKIYFRHFRTGFEYLTIIQGELYTAYFEIKPTKINRLFYFFKIEKMVYSQQQLKKILNRLNRAAEATIDFVLDKDKKPIPVEK